MKDGTRYQTREDGGWRLMGLEQQYSWSGTAEQMIRAQRRIKLPPLHTF